MSHDITRELCAFLVCQHGLDWLARLLRLRSSKFYERSSPNAVRTRGQSDELSERDGELIEDVSAGVDVLRQFAESNWWSWEDGSTLVFWRWPVGDQRRYARDGMEVYITANLPQNRCPARPPNAEKRPFILDKIKKILKRGYATIPDMPFFI